MGKCPILVIGFALLSCFVLSSCSAQEAETISSPTETAAAAPTSDSAGDDSDEIADSQETGAEETETYEERSIHISLNDNSIQAEYAYRSFIQIPIGMAFGPDGCMYICDWGGKHIVKVDKEGNMCDLELWKNNRYIQQDGPRCIDFDSQGNLYFNNHGYIFRLNTDGSLETLKNIANCQPIGSIAVSPDDTLYYTDRGNGKVYSLSGGNQQKFLLARTLATECRVLIMLEPTRGIDVGAKAEIYALLEDLAKSGIAIIMVSSELPEIMGNCHRTLVVFQGKLTGDISKEEFDETMIMQCATGNKNHMETRN